MLLCTDRLAEPQLGDVICDPMCGGGSIPIEVSTDFDDKELQEFVCITV